ncbi:Phosphatidic acid phosphatase type 2/haloperoxidase [Trypanosoma melophagium]|uniref:Phosphatidic acid phosphatase type 2/haloperoxidase n=1 Tax=Trypanosoma melophagium TaxID=715481 RepID=UPI00351A8917|nr:Phosphatidic acid phosphatase type 2/haloperoxidase [Trypanosoma melophagium]
MSSAFDNVEPHPGGNSLYIPHSVLFPPTVTGCVTATASTPTSKQFVQERISFRSWYMSNYCNDDHVSIILRAQKCFPKLQWLITLYFKFWSCTGEIEFYTAFIPLVVWLGMPYISFNVCVLMCISQYITGVMKDMAGCPRPPCPPVQLRGRRFTSKEYGYPSTHVSHSVVFAYAVFDLLLACFPNSPVLCWIFCVVFAINVALSRLFLGMHWLADLVVGGGVGVIIITFHRAFLESILEYVYELSDAMIWHFLLGFLILHILVVSHAAPVDKCPCYLDSLRFLGATFGAIFGCWLFHSQYGMLTARSNPEDVLDVLLSVRFLVQYLSCLFVLLVVREIVSFLSVRVLRFIFLQLSRGASPHRSLPWQRVWYVFSHAMRCAYGIQRYQYSNIGSPMDMGRKRRQLNFNISTSGSCGSDTPDDMEYIIKTTAERQSLEEDALMEGVLQLWSPRTHRHWWLWETQRCAFSYFVVGLMTTYFCPVILRVFFGVE